MGSQLAYIALVIESLILKASSLFIPMISRVLSSMPKIILPPKPLAKAITVLRYFLWSFGSSLLNSMFPDSLNKI